MGGRDTKEYLLKITKRTHSDTLRIWEPCLGKLGKGAWIKRKKKSLHLVSILHGTILNANDMGMVGDEKACVMKNN